TDPCHSRTGGRAGARPRRLPRPGGAGGAAPALLSALEPWSRPATDLSKRPNFLLPVSEVRPRFASTPLLAADHPLVPGEIHETSPVLEACGFEEALHHSSLACAHLEGQHPPRHQVRRYL